MRDPYILEELERARAYRDKVISSGINISDIVEIDPKTFCMMLEAGMNDWVSINGIGEGGIYYSLIEYEGVRYCARTGLELLLIYEYVPTNPPRNKPPGPSYKLVW